MANLEDSIVATLFDQSKEVANQVIHHNVLLSTLEDRGNVRRFSGGYEIRKPVLYNETAQGNFYSGYDAFDLSAINDLDAFQFAIRQVYEPMAISGREKRANMSEEMLLDLVENKMEASVARLKNRVSDSILGDGTAFGGREFDGVSKMVTTSPSSGTYGSIDRLTNTWARNLAVSSGGLTTSNVQAQCTEIIMRLSRGSEGPDLALATRANWSLLHQTLTPIQRINDKSDKAKGGFKAISWNGVDFVFDGGYGGSVLASGIRFLNTKYVTFDIVREADFKPAEQKPVRPVDQDAFFTVILVEGNLCCSAPALQGVLT